MYGYTISGSFLQIPDNASLPNIEKRLFYWVITLCPDRKTVYPSRISFGTIRSNKGFSIIDYVVHVVR